MKQFLRLGLVLWVYVICTGCGETFRPIIIPNPPVFPNPLAAHSVLSINGNYSTATINNSLAIVPLPGTAMSIDVSGDSDVSIANLGIAPVLAAQQSANQVLVVNQAVTNLPLPPTGCTVTMGLQNYNVCPSLSQVTFSGTVISSVGTISLPPGSAPNFVAVAPSSTTAYVTLPNLSEIAVISTTTSNQVATIPVGSNPNALVVTPDNTKLYVANQGPPSTISGFNTVDRSQRAGSPVTTNSPPIWMVARSDSEQVYVLQQNGTLAWLNTTSTAGPDTLTSTTISVPGAIKMVYDPNLNRVYVPGGSQVAIVDVSQSAPSTIVTIPIAAIQPSARTAGDPCARTTATTLNTIDVAPLPNGNDAYVGSYYEDTSGNICPQVAVIDTVSNVLEAYIAIPGIPAYDAFCSPAQYAQAPRFRIMMAAGGDSTRAYLSSCDGGNVSIIDTSSQSYIVNMPAPVSSRAPAAGSTLNPPQNPVFLLAGP